MGEIPIREFNRWMEEDDREREEKHEVDKAVGVGLLGGFVTLLLLWPFSVWLIWAPLYEWATEPEAKVSSGDVCVGGGLELDGVLVIDEAPIGPLDGPPMSTLRPGRDGGWETPRVESVEAVYCPCGEHYEQSMEKNESAGVWVTTVRRICNPCGSAREEALRRGGMTE
jgi:hypothetical protein